MNDQPWVDPETENEILWFQIVDLLASPEDEEKYLCPDCQAQQLRFYYLRFSPGTDDGGFWIWCPHCHGYMHFRCRVPAWWQIHWVPLGEEPTHAPSWIETHWHVFGRSPGQ